MRKARTRIAALRTKKPAAIHRSVRGGSRSSCGRSGSSSAIVLHQAPHAEALAAGEPQGAQPAEALLLREAGEGDHAKHGGGGGPKRGAWACPPPPPPRAPPPPPSRRGGGGHYGWARPLGAGGGVGWAAARLSE